jgi:6-phosphogluconate dehydrogenase
MKVGVIGLGRMGGGIARRLMRAGIDCVVYDESAAATAAVVADGATRAASLHDVVGQLEPPRVVWLMIPAAGVDAVIDATISLFEPGDTIIDGGNSHYRDDIERSRRLEPRGVHYLDCGTSGGGGGAEDGYCLMVGGETAIIATLTPVFAALGRVPPPGEHAPAVATRAGQIARGFLHCGASGAGHFVKMVHNGIEYGLMAAYAEGFNILRGANAGLRTTTVDAETTPLRNPEYYQYELDLAAIAAVWRHGSIVRSWLLDLAAKSLAADPGLTAFSGNVADSGEGRWALEAAIDEGIPAFMLASALSARFSARGEGLFANRLLSALRDGFGGHIERLR